MNGILGKVIGATLGLVLFHSPLMMLLGLAIGHLFDSGMLRGAHRAGEPLGFVEPLFAVLGAVAKTDGRVSEAEIATVERLMTRLDLDPLWRRRAIDSFNKGKAPGFDVGVAVGDLRAWCALRRSYAMPLLDMAAETARADGPPPAEKLKILRRLAWSLHIGELQLMALLAMKGFVWNAGGYGSAQQDYAHAWSGARSAPPHGDTPDPYAVLGVPRDTDERTIKRAYRKLISEHHPDKLGDLPADMRRRAEQRASEINAAYERIQSEKGFR